MTSKISFILSDGSVMPISIRQLDREIELEYFRLGDHLWGFQPFIESDKAKRIFCEHILVWPFRDLRTLREVRLEVPPRANSCDQWSGNSAELACFIAMSRSQSDRPVNSWPDVIATGTMQRASESDAEHDMRVNAVEGGDSFTEKLKGVLAHTPATEFFVYPADQRLNAEHRQLLARIRDNGTTALPAGPMQVLYAHNLCPAPPAAQPSTLPDNSASIGTGNDPPPTPVAVHTPGDDASRPRPASGYRGKVAVLLSIIAIITLLPLAVSVYRSNAPAINPPRLDSSDRGLDSPLSDVASVRVSNADLPDTPTLPAPIPTPIANLRVSLIPEMVTIPAGYFFMGCDQGDACFNEQQLIKRTDLPRHDVHPSSFRIGITEVTRAQYQQFLDATGHDFVEGDDRPEQHPATFISWNDTQAYLGWLNETTGSCYRLPTESEWEYATRAETTTLFNTGDELTSEHAKIWERNTVNGTQTTQGPYLTSEVGMYKPNAWGLYDTHGGVWEWVQDSWRESYLNAPKDGSAYQDDSEHRRVLRGGSFSVAADFASSSMRIGNPAWVRFNSVGFRVAADLHCQ